MKISLNRIQVLRNLMKPSSEIRKLLNESGKSSYDALDVMNCFYKHDFALDNFNIFNEYWQIKVAILCDRIVNLEKKVNNGNK